MRKGQIVGELPGYQKDGTESDVHSLEEQFMALAVGARPALIMRRYLGQAFAADGGSRSASR